VQVEFNEEHDIIPRSVQKPVRDSLSPVEAPKSETLSDVLMTEEKLPEDELLEVVLDLEAHMKNAAERLDFEKAALYRDQLRELEVTYGKATMQRLQQNRKRRRKK